MTAPMYVHKGADGHWHADCRICTPRLLAMCASVRTWAQALDAAFAHLADRHSLPEPLRMAPNARVDESELAELRARFLRAQEEPHTLTVLSDPAPWGGEPIRYQQEPSYDLWRQEQQSLRSWTYEVGAATRAEFIRAQNEPAAYTQILGL